MIVEYDEATNKAAWVMLDELTRNLGVEMTPKLFNGVKVSVQRVLQEYVNLKNLEASQ